MLSRARLHYYKRILSSLSLNRAFNLFRLRASYYFTFYSGHYYHSGKPWSVSIEPTTACNLRCPECPAGLRQLKRPTGKISLNDFSLWLERLSPELQYLILYFQGEPFLHPEIISMIKMACDKNILTATSTNAHSLNPDTCAAIVSSGLHEILISLDGTDGPTYEKYRRGGDFELAVSGIRNLTLARKQSQKPHPYIRLQFIVMKHNEQQIKEIKKLGKSLGVDKVELKTAQINDPADPHDLLTNLRPFARYRKTENGQLEPLIRRSRGCRRMWESSIITWDGNLLPCCYDKHGEYSFGKNDAEAWKSPAAASFRKNVLQSRKIYPMCTVCHEK